MLVAALAATVAVALGRPTSSAGWPTSATAATRCRRNRSRSPACSGRGRSCRTTHAAAARLSGRAWSYPLPPTPIANGSIEGRIEDAQGRINLNNAALDGTNGAAERARLGLLFAAKGLDPKVARRARRLDRHRLARARQRRRRRLVRAAILRHAGCERAAPAHGRARVGARCQSERMGGALAPHVAALPPGTTLNINTADGDAIAAALPDLAGEKLAAFISERARKPFTTMAELRERLPQGRCRSRGRLVRVLERLFPGQRALAPGRCDRPGTRASQARRPRTARGRVADARVGHCAEYTKIPLVGKAKALRDAASG